MRSWVEARNCLRPNTGKGLGPLLSRPKLSVALLLVAAAFLAVGQAQVTDDGYIKPQDSNCWDCHGPGKDTPDMDPALIVRPDFSTTAVGESVDYKVAVENSWLGVVSGIRVTMDISDAPSVQFTGALGALDPVQIPGTVTIDPATISPENLSQSYYTDILVSIENGTTDLILELTPDETDANLGPDFTLYVQPAESEDPENSIIDPINNAPKGGTETFHAKGGSDFGQYGYGTWKIRAEMTPLGTGIPPTLDPAVGDVGFTINLRAWSNATGETQKVAVDDIGFGEDNVGGGASLFTFPLEVLSEPDASERIQLIINATFFHDHENSNDPDYWDATFDRTVISSLEIPLTTATSGPDTGSAIIGTDLSGTIVTGPVLVSVTIARISEVVGYASALLMLGSIYSGGIFGKATRRSMNKLFGSAKRRVAFHNFLSYGLTVAALVHMFIFMWDVNTGLAEDGYHWLVGVLWGGPAILAMFALGVTGAIQVPMIRRWNYATWRWTHFWLAIAAIVFTLIHMGLDGQNFAWLQNSIDWNDPLVPEGF